jgi:hypothetical protein
MKEALVKRVDLTSEAYAVEASSSVIAAGVLLADWRWPVAVGWGVVAGIAAGAAIQATRLLRMPEPDANDVNLLCLDIGEEKQDAPTTDLDDEATTAFGILLATIAIPFVVAYVLIRMALTYVVPLGIVWLAAAQTDAHWLRAALVAVTCVLISLAHELAVVHPLARRYDVDIG